MPYKISDWIVLHEKELFDFCILIGEELSKYHIEAMIYTDFDLDKNHECLVLNSVCRIQPHSPTERIIQSKYSIGREMITMVRKDDDIPQYARSIAAYVLQKILLSRREIENPQIPDVRVF